MNERVKKIDLPSHVVQLVISRCRIHTNLFWDSDGRHVLIVEAGKIIAEAWDACWKDGWTRHPYSKATIPVFMSLEQPRHCGNGGVFNEDAAQFESVLLDVLGKPQNWNDNYAAYAKER